MRGEAGGRPGGAAGVVSLVALPLVLALPGCGDLPAPGPRTLARDSAGVRIVETTVDARLPAPWVLGDSATRSVGAVEGEAAYLLNRVVGAMKLPDGEIVVANRGTNELRFYDEEGVFLRAEGREGDGPGEFQYLRALGPCRAGGFVAFDLNWQMNAYTDDGRFVDRTMLRTPGGRTPYNLACDEHGHLLMLGWGYDASAGPVIGFHQTRDRLLLTTREGEIQTDFGERLVSERLGRRTGSGPHPAGRATKFGLHDDVVYVGSGERFEIELRDLDGSLEALLRGPAVPLEVSDSLKDAYLEAALAAAPSERAAAIRREVEGWEWPPAVPAYTALRVDPAGVAWLRAFTADPAQPETWSLLDPERGYLGDLRLRPGQSLLEPGLDHVLVLTRDELDVERVLELPLERESGSRDM